MPGRFLPPDHSRGDANTIGGYQRVHGRPAAFEGSDGWSYSVEIAVDRTDDAEEYAAFFLFLRWRRIGAQGVEGHLETDYLERGPTAAAARDALGSWSLDRVRQYLEERIAEVHGPTTRKWWDVMKEE